jgi:serine/threonine protein kinase
VSDLLERLVGALEGRYTVKRQIGEGGMATVYLAYCALNWAVGRTASSVRSSWRQACVIHIYSLCTIPER